jgi:hypothetical protein
MRFTHMPRYTFNMAPGPIVDHDGLDLPDDDAARREAELIARDFVRSKSPAADDRMVAARADGTIVHEVYLQKIATLK